MCIEAFIRRGGLGYDKQLQFISNLMELYQYRTEENIKTILYMLLSNHKI